MTKYKLETMKTTTFLWFEERCGGGSDSQVALLVPRDLGWGILLGGGPEVLATQADDHWSVVGTWGQPRCKPSALAPALRPPSREVVSPFLPLVISPLARRTGRERKRSSLHCWLREKVPAWERGLTCDLNVGRAPHVGGESVKLKESNNKRVTMERRILHTPQKKGAATIWCNRVQTGSGRSGPKGTLWQTDPLQHEQRGLFFLFIYCDERKKSRSVSNPLKKSRLPASFLLRRHREQRTKWGVKALLFPLQIQPHPPSRQPQRTNRGETTTTQKRVDESHRLAVNGARNPPPVSPARRTATAVQSTRFAGGGNGRGHDLVSYANRRSVTQFWDLALVQRGQ